MIIKKTKALKIFNFIIKEYHINEEMKRLKRKKTKKIKIKGETIAKTLFMCMFTREKSFNQIMEKIHKRKKYRKIYRKNEHIPKMHVFRDGVETFGSYQKDWENSYKVKRKVEKYRNGKKEEIEKEYHKQINIFAKIVGKRPGIILGYEKVTSKGNKGKQEYEPNVAIKLIKRLKEMYGRGIDVIVGDAIYLEEKFIKEVKKEGYEAVIRLKENRKAIIEEAEGLFKLQEGKEYKYKNKTIRSCTEVVEHKSTKLKVVKYKETYKKGKEEKEDIIYVASTDLGMKEETINKKIHGRWDIENEGFNELKNQCQMKHCYMSKARAIDVIIQMMIISYNLWELYIYGHLHDFKKLGMTKIGYIENVVESIEQAKREEIIFSSA